MSNYRIRRAEENDLPELGRIYAVARQFMRNNGNPHQWQGGYPQKELLLSDIRKGTLYAVVKDGILHGVFYFAVEEDPTYHRIDDGDWLSDAPYGVIHRIASDGSGGIFAAALAFCCEKINHLRIDTHADNKPMQHVVEKHGFHRCGIIYVSDGSPRIAYEKI